MESSRTPTIQQGGNRPSSDGSSSFHFCDNLRFLLATQQDGFPSGDTTLYARRRGKLCGDFVVRGHSICSLKDCTSACLHFLLSHVYVLGPFFCYTNFCEKLHDLKVVEFRPVGRTVRLGGLCGQRGPQLSGKRKKHQDVKTRSTKIQVPRFLKNDLLFFLNLWTKEVGMLESDWLSLNKNLAQDCRLVKLFFFLFFFEKEGREASKYNFLHLLSPKFHLHAILELHVR